MRRLERVGARKLLNTRTTMEAASASPLRDCTLEQLRLSLQLRSSRKRGKMGGPRRRGRCDEDGKNAETGGWGLNGSRPGGGGTGRALAKGAEWKTRGAWHGGMGRGGEKQEIMKRGQGPRSCPHVGCRVAPGAPPDDPAKTLPAAKTHPPPCSRLPPPCTTPRIARSACAQAPPAGRGPRPLSTGKVAVT